MTDKLTKAPAAPRDRRLPVASAKLRIPVSIGSRHGIRYLESGKDDVPQMYLDPELRTLSIGDELIPFDGAMVKSVKRAKMAKS